MVFIEYCLGGPFYSIRSLGNGAQTVSLLLSVRMVHFVVNITPVFSRLHNLKSYHILIIFSKFITFHVETSIHFHYGTNRLKIGSTWWKRVLSPFTYRDPPLCIIYFIYGLWTGVVLCLLGQL